MKFCVSTEKSLEKSSQGFYLLFQVYVLQLIHTISINAKWFHYIFIKRVLIFLFYFTTLFITFSQHKAPVVLAMHFRNF